MAMDLLEKFSRKKLILDTVKNQNIIHATTCSEVARDGGATHCQSYDRAGLIRYSVYPSKVLKNFFLGGHKDGF